MRANRAQEGAVSSPVLRQQEVCHDFIEQNAICTILDLGVLAMHSAGIMTDLVAHCLVLVR